MVEVSRSVRSGGDTGDETARRQAKSTWAVPLARSGFAGGPRNSLSVSRAPVRPGYVTDVGGAASDEGGTAVALIDESELREV